MALVTYVASVFACEALTTGKDMSDALHEMELELAAMAALNEKLADRIAKLEADRDVKGFEPIDDGALKRSYCFQYEGISGLVECYEKVTRIWWNGKEYKPSQAPSDLLMTACKADSIQGR